MLIEERLWGGTHRIHWTPEQIAEVCRHFRVDPHRIERRRELSSPLPPPSSSEKAPANAKAFTFVISTSSVDRVGDTIAVEGWKTGAYSRNPVVLWGHDNHSPPIGRATRIFRDGNRLMATMQFGPSRFAQNIREGVEAGYIKATSVGFLPIKFKFSRDAARGNGIDFIEQELLEFSIVSVPANAEALVESRSGECLVESREAYAQKLALARRRRELDVIKLRGGP